MADGEQVSVYLSFVESPITDKDHVDWTTNKIGGSPLFSPTLEDELVHNLLVNDIKCKKCRQLCVFLGQIASQVDDKQLDRIIYLFACQRNKCDYFMAVRCLTPFHNGSSSKDTSKLENLDRIAIFKPFYLGVDNEADLEEDRQEELAKMTIPDAQIDTSSDAVEKYENIEIETVFGGDKVAYRFHKRLRKYPDQLIRYSWTGTPLMNKEGINLEVKRCETCGKDRVYECQLMPGLINELIPLKKNSKMSLDFGTVLIFSCSENCDQSKLSFEECIFLKEPDSDEIDEFFRKRNKGKK